MEIIAYAIQAFNLVRAAMEAGMALKNVYDIIERTNAALADMDAQNRGPSDAEWDTLNKETEDLRAQRPEIISEGE